MDKLKLSGIVLASFPQGEYDKRIIILTKERGRITAFARGARKSHSPLLGTTNPFVYGTFGLYEGRNSYTLVETHISNYFPYFTNNLKEAYLGFYFLEFMNHYTRENNDEYSNLKLLYMSLLAITDTKHNLELSRCIFKWKYLVINGIAPPKDKYSTLQKSTIYALDYLKQCDVKNSFSFDLREEERNEFINFVDGYYTNHIKHEFSSYELYKNLE